MEIGGIGSTHRAPPLKRKSWPRGATENKKKKQGNKNNKEGEKKQSEGLGTTICVGPWWNLMNTSFFGLLLACEGDKRAGWLRGRCFAEAQGGPQAQGENRNGPARNLLKGWGENSSPGPFGRAKKTNPEKTRKFCLNQPVITPTTSASHFFRLIGLFLRSPTPNQK